MTGSLQIKNNKYYVVINVKRNGKRYQRWISTGIDVKNNKRKAEQEMNRILSTYKEQSEMEMYARRPFSEYIDKYLEEKKISVELSTYEGYYNHSLYITNYLGKTKMKDINSSIVSDLYVMLLKDGRVKKSSSSTKKGLSIRTVRDVSVLLKAILERAVENGIIENNPAKNVKLPTIRKEYKQDVYLDEEDIKHFLEIIKGTELEYLFTFTLYFGLRRSEVLGLCWDAVDLKKRVLTIKRTVVKNNTIVEKNRTKTESSYREYPLSDYVCDVLKQIRTNQKKMRALFGNEYIETNKIFCWSNGRDYRPDYITKEFRRIVKKDDKLPSELVLHDLRKSCVSVLLLSGQSVTAVQHWVGHSTPDMTLEVYAKINKKRLIETSNTMDNIFEK